ncbi:MAG: hypothetical protein LBQ50_13105, partial [Planctomycetaceae bacterium]|nr:hypothetical protein [Planctomycetaceae bacterium]
MQRFSLILFCSFFCFSTAFAFELGDAAKFAVRFDDKTGNMTEILYHGEPITIPGGGDQQFDIQATLKPAAPNTVQDADWIFGKGKLELVGIEKESPSAVNVTQKIGDWIVMFRYSVDVPTATLGRNVELTYNGKKPVKIKNFWMSLPTFPFRNDAEFFIPGQYPPKKFTPENFGTSDQNARQGSWRNSAPLVLQIDKTKSVILLSDNLIDYADRPNSGIERRDGGVRLTQSFDVKGHVKPGSVQKLGDAYFRVVNSDSETALLQIHDLMRYLKHVPPNDRPKWFESAILYSFHPGGTIGSGCRDLGGFKNSMPLLDQIKQLGCNAIWLMPLEDKSIYWPRDYYKFQEGLGTTPETAPTEYKALVKKAHELGLHVLQDSVPHGGGIPNKRSEKHPEWLVQDEDGSTLNYWGFDFNHPTWIDYMGEVARYYVKEYGIDGYRVDACGGSKIPNWNPEIPYSRASHSQSQGGLNMLRKIRQSVKEEQPDGGILAEVNTGIWGAVSDATYDFDLCYTVLHDARKLPAEEFITRLRRWLHEQQYSEIPDMLRLRHVESHDSLRAQLWYGTEPHQKLVALTAFIHGIPLVYHEEEIGHESSFRQIFDVRKALPELNGGDADYLSVDAPPGVFAVLRTKGDDASIAVIDFTGGCCDESTMSIPCDKLPKNLRSQNEIYCLRLGDEKPFQIKKTDHRLILDDLSCLNTDVFILRKNEQAFEEPQFSKQIKEIGQLPESIKRSISSWKEAISENFIKLDARQGNVGYIIYIDTQTGLPVYCVDNNLLINAADILLPKEVKEKAEKPVIDIHEKEIFVKQKFGQAILETRYSIKSNYHVFIESRWTGNDIPKNAVFSLPIAEPITWMTGTIEGTLAYRYHPQLQHSTPDGFYSSIYWRPQGTNIIFDSLMTPQSNWGNQFTSATHFINNSFLNIDFGNHPPIRYRQAVLNDNKRDITLLFSWTDETVPQIKTAPFFSLEIALSFHNNHNNHSNHNNDNPIRPTIGGYVYENNHYKLRLTRSGTIMSLDTKDGKQIVHQ